MTQALSTQSVVVVVGAGAMGAGIAQVAASAGHPVRLFDKRPDAAASAIAGIRQQFEKLVVKGKMSPQVAQDAGERLQAVHQLADLADAALVVEAVVENLQAKQQLFCDLETVVSAQCLFGSNTSSISITAIGSALQHPQRLAGLHFFNPAPLMALVEVVSGLATDAAVAQTLFDTAAAWGKTPVHARSTPGFIVNRVARPYYAEALRVLAEGGADAATLDACCREAGGFRMGPFELMDLIGHDVNFAVTQSVWRAFFNDPRFQPSLIQQELVEAGFLGKKTGRGFFQYHHGAARPQVHTKPQQVLSVGIELFGQSRATQGLAARLRAAGVPFEQFGGQGDTVMRAGGACLRVTDGRTATHCAFADDAPNTVVMDLALDYRTATRIAVGVAQQCSRDSAMAIIGVLQAAGLAVSRLQDIPGLIVMRTVAMLVNEAADAVNQGVCHAAGVDTAMQLGVNYPRGPLAWGQEIGLAHVGRVLGNLALTYGEDRYRTSPLIQQQIYSNKGFS